VVLAPATTLRALASESTYCTDNGGCTEGAASFGEHLLVAAVGGVLAMLSIGLPIFLGTRAFPQRRGRVWGNRPRRRSLGTGGRCDRTVV